MNAEEQPMIVVKDLYKSFKLPHEQHNGIKQAIINFAKRKKGYEVQHVLDDISFEVKQGEFFGIVGRNGSGKSTLLKLLAGIYSSDRGVVRVNGSLTPFIELGVGFNPELTGRENVFLNGALLGFSRSEMLGMYDEIVDFAEIRNFMDQKLKNYSSGMQVRLAFSIAIRANTPILLIDEVLAVGDSEFQAKCYAEFRKLKKAGRTIIFVTHDMGAVERFCDRVLVLKSGKVEGVFMPDKAAIIYEKMNISSSEGTDSGDSNRWGTREVSIAKVELFGSDKKNTTIITQGEDIEIKIDFANHSVVKKITVGLAFHDMFGANISGPNSSKLNFDSSKNVTFKIPRLSFASGKYVLTAAVYDENSEVVYDHIVEAASFTVLANGQQQYGKINLFGEWEQ